MTWTKEAIAALTPEEFWALADHMGISKKIEDRAKGFVYFLQAEVGGPIKIGFAYDPPERMRQLQTGQPYRLEILKIIKGGKKKEQSLHRKFAGDRLKGEWFKPSDDLLVYIRRAYGWSAPDWQNEYGC